MVKDSEGAFLSTRRRETNVKKRGCPVEYYLSHRIVNKETDQRAFKGVWRNESHQNHLLHLNPFSFSVHEQSTEAFQCVIPVARKYRSADVPYSTVCQLLMEEGNGLIISERTYYNTVRDRQSNKEDGNTISGLIRALRDQDFKFRLRFEEEYEGDGDKRKILSKKLVQIFFWQSQTAQLARQFAADYAIALDGTFNTNKLRLPLLVATSETNTEKIFPVAFSYCPGETVESYNFFFTCLKEEIFTKDVLDPAVVIADQASGLFSSFDNHNSMPNSELQICIWYTVEAMLAKFRKAGRYLSEEIDGIKDDQGNKVQEGLEDFCWTYVKSYIITELDTNRQRVLDHLKAPE